MLGSTRCLRCGAMNEVANRMCDQCGSALAPSAGAARRIIRIGRADDNEIPVPSNAAQVSRYHAQVTLDSSGNLLIRDLGTSNSTMVNGRPAVQDTAFTLHDDITFGSYRFNTALLQPHIAGPAPVSPLGAGKGIRPPQIHAPAAGMVVAGRRTFFDRAFDDKESSWMPTFLLAYGIILILLFFLPIGVVRDQVVAAISLLGDDRTNGWLKLVFVLMPITGAALIVLRTLGARKAIVGAVLIAAALPALGTVTAAMELLPKLGGNQGWQLLFRWLFMCGTSAALLYLSTRPREPLGKALLAVFAPMLVLSYLFPTNIPGAGASVELIATIQALEHASAPTVVWLVLNLVPFLLGLGSLVFLGGPPKDGVREAAQIMAIAIVGMPVLAVFLAFIAFGIQGNEPGMIMSAVWFALFLSYFYFFPVFGGTLLMLGLRPHGAAAREWR